MVNLTLVGFFVSYCVFLLFYGPLSDRFGRRPLLLAGIFIFVIASLLCAIADNVVSLIIFRVLQAAGIYLQLFRNRRYLGYALMLSLVVLPHFAFIGESADIYITRFGLSEQVFGYFFAVNAAAIMAGSFACTRLLHRVGSRGLLTAGFAGILIGGGAMVLRWLPGPWGLALPMAVISFSFGLSRPPSNNLVIEQVDRNAGAASSLLIFIYFMLGAFSMWLISLDWPDKIRLIGVLGAASGGMILGIWLLIPKFTRGKKTGLCQEGKGCP